MRQQSWPKLAPMQGLAFLDGAAAHTAPAPPLQSWLSAARSARRLPRGAAHGHRGGGRGVREQRSVTAPPLRQPPHPVPASRAPARARFQHGGHLALASLLLSVSPRGAGDPRGLPALSELTRLSFFCVCPPLRCPPSNSRAPSRGLPRAAHTDNARRVPGERPNAAAAVHRTRRALPLCFRFLPGGWILLLK